MTVMQRRWRLAMLAPLLGLWLLTAPGSGAQESAPPIPEEAARKMLELGLKNIDRAVCDGFNLCAPATPHELQYPPITIDQVRAAMLVGGRSAVARWCGLDADRRSILPMMQQLRKARLNNRQLALIAVIHGIQQSIVSEQLKARGECDAQTRTKLDAQLPRL